jgi:pimeloyl-ACP methyl ester carboxylesterase
MKAFRIAMGLLGLTCLVLVAAVLMARWGLWAPSYASVKARYAGPPSQFIQVGGVSLHVRDEGQGPVLILMHSSMTNLREWDAWADRLKSHYRVIRLDWPPYGLSVDPAGPYSMANAEATLERFADQMRLARFTLIGSSSGALICVLYAARHPERVDALALSTLPLAAPPPSKVDPRVTALLWMHKTFFPAYFPKIYYTLFLRGLFADPAKVTPALVDWYWATNTIPGAQARVAAYLKADIKTIWKKTGHDAAEKVTAPVLLQWGDADPVLPAALGEAAKAHLRNAPVTLIHYRDAGHYPMLEIPEKTEADLERFLARVYPARG